MKRRGFLGWLAGAAAAPVVAKVLPEDGFKVLREPLDVETFLPESEPYSTGCTAVPHLSMSNYQTLDDVIYASKPIRIK